MEEQVAGDFGTPKEKGLWKEKRLSPGSRRPRVGEGDRGKDQPLGAVGAVWGGCTSSCSLPAI